MSISTLTESESISYGPTIICGDCSNFAHLHPVVRNGFTVCNREPYEVGDRYAERYNDDDFQFDTLDGLILENLSGPGVIERTEHWDIEPEIPDGYDGEYNDLDHNEVTVTLDQYRKGQRPVNTVEVQKSAFVEGNDGFIIVEVFDPILTEKYAFKLLNAYKSNGKQRVGSIELEFNSHQVTATCVKCKEAMLINTVSPMMTRELMQSVVFDIIRHGNNHAAKWFTQRDEFYKIHEPHCDLNNCNVNEAGCSNEVTELHIAQLKEHFEHVA